MLDSPSGPAGDSTQIDSPTAPLTTKTIQFERRGPSAATPPGAPPTQRLRIGAGVMLVVGVLGVILGQRIMNTGNLTGGLLPYAAGATFIGVAAWLTATRRPLTFPRFQFFTDDNLAIGMLSLLAFGGAWLTYRLAAQRSLTDSVWDIAAIWLGAHVALALIAIRGWHPSPPARAAFSWSTIRRWPWLTIAALVAVLAIALTLRLWKPNAYSTVSTGDDWFFTITARDFRDGIVRNPFQMHMWLVPMDLITAIRGWTSRPFPDEVASYRYFGALYGVATIWGVFLLGRRLLGTWIGIAGAAALACMAIHIWGSRITMNNAFDAFSFVFALWALARAFDTQHRRDAILCGIFTALGLYGYWGGRVFLLFIALCLPVILIGPNLGRRVADMLRLAVWIAISFVVTAAPAIAFFDTHPGEFMSRANRITESIQPTVSDRAELIFRALLFPFYAEQGFGAASFYRQAPPFLGWSIAPFFAIGIVTWIAWLVSQIRTGGKTPYRPALLLLAWLVTVLPVSQTEAMGSQRFFAVMPMWALAAGTGVAVVIRAVQAILGEQRWIPIVLGCAIALGLTADAAHQTFSVQPAMFEDPYGIRSYDLGWRLHGSDDTLTLLQAGFPEINYEGAGAWLYFAPNFHDRSPSFNETFTVPAGNAPVIADNQVMILSPERNGETCAILARNPGVAIAEGRASDGMLLYMLFSQDPGFNGMRPSETSPANARLTRISPPPC